jgi:hypothetical protein
MEQAAAAILVLERLLSLSVAAAGEPVVPISLRAARPASAPSLVRRAIREGWDCPRHRRPEIMTELAQRSIDAAKDGESGLSTRIFSLIVWVETSQLQARQKALRNVLRQLKTTRERAGSPAEHDGTTDRSG